MEETLTRQQVQEIAIKHPWMGWQRLLDETAIFKPESVEFFNASYSPTSTVGVLTYRVKVPQ